MEGGECSKEGSKKEEPAEIEPSLYACSNPECTRSRPNSTSANLCVHAQQKKKEEEDKRRERELIASGEWIVSLDFIFYYFLFLIRIIPLDKRISTESRIDKVD